MADVRVQKKMKQGRHASAIKRARQALKQQARNRMAKQVMRKAMKAVRVAVSKKNKDQALSTLKTATPIIAKTASRGVVHWKTGARYISRLTQAVNKLN